jgi:hypothetical protein
MPIKRSPPGACSFDGKVGTLKRSQAMELPEYPTSVSVAAAHLWQFVEPMLPAHARQPQDLNAGLTLADPLV